MKCPSCGAEIGTNKVCSFCGMQISYEMLKEQEQLNKAGCPKCGSTNVQFKRENQGEAKQKNGKKILHRTVGFCQDCGHTWYPDTRVQGKNSKLWLWALGWILIFPVPLTILMLRKKEMNPALKYAIIAIGWIAYFGIALGHNSANKNETTAETTVARQASGTAADAATEDAAAAAEETETTEEATEEAIAYTAVTVQEMMDDLSDNALKAQDKYNGQYLEVTGILSVIDSSGKYISLHADEFSFVGVRCDLKNDTQKSQVGNMSAGDTVTVRGKCTNVGEVLGYSLAVDSIDGYEDAGEELSFARSADGYMEVSANELSEIIKDNAMKAQNTFKGQQIAVSGKLGTIDSNGSYITISSDNSFDFTNIQCYLKNDAQKAQIMEMSKGDSITIRGKCRDVGEILGYQIDIESID